MYSYLKMKHLKCLFLFLYTFIVFNSSLILATNLYKKNYRTNNNKKNNKRVSPNVFKSNKKQHSDFFHGSSKVRKYKRASPKNLDDSKQKNDALDIRRSKTVHNRVSMTSSSLTTSALITLSKHRNEDHGLMAFQSTGNKLLKGGSKSSGGSSNEKSGSPSSSGGSSGKKGGSGGSSEKKGGSGGSSEKKGGNKDKKASDKAAKSDKKGSDKEAKSDKKGSNKEAKSDKKASDKAAKSDKKASDKAAKSDKKASDKSAKSDKKGSSKTGKSGNGISDAAGETMSDVAGQAISDINNGVPKVFNVAISPASSAPLQKEVIADPNVPAKIKTLNIPPVEPKVSIPDPIYKYRRSDLDRDSELYIPASIRNRWKYYIPSRMAVGMPLAQEGDAHLPPESIKKWESGKTPLNENGMPMDIFPNPIDPPNYKAKKLDDNDVSFD